MYITYGETVIQYNIPIVGNMYLLNNDSIFIDSSDKTVNEYIDAYANIDLARMLGFSANTDGFVFAGDGTLVVGYNSYFDQLINAVKNAVKINSINNESPHIYVLAKNAALYAMQFS